MAAEHQCSLECVGDSCPITRRCKGGKCDNPARCNSAGCCTYKSSAEEAREILVAGQRVRNCGMCQSPGCVLCFPVEQAKTVAVTQIVTTRQTMPLDSAERKKIPLCTGVLDYFPAALAAVARLSQLGNDKHNPGQALHWSRSKSSDHADCLARHLADRGVIDPDTKMSHTVEVAWRALALLQEEEETRGAPKARGAQ